MCEKRQNWGGDQGSGAQTMKIPTKVKILQASLLYIGSRC